MAINANKHELGRKVGRRKGEKRWSRNGMAREREEKNGDITRLVAKRRIKQAVMIAGVL